MSRAAVAKWLLPVAVVVLLVCAWQAYVAITDVSVLVLPSPAQVGSALWNDRGALASNLRVTAEEIILGLLLATTVAAVCAAGIHFSQLARRALYPLLVGSQAVPVVIIGPVLVLWLGFGVLSKVVVIGLVCLFPIIVTTLAALQSVDVELVKLLRTFGATRMQVFRRVELPWALPGLFTGLKLAAVFSVIGAILAEQSGSSSGLGYLMTTTVAQLNTAEAFATVVVLSAFAIALFAFLTAVERRLLPWAYRQKPRQT